MEKLRMLQMQMVHQKREPKQSQFKICMNQDSSTKKSLLMKTEIKSIHTLPKETSTGKIERRVNSKNTFLEYLIMIASNFEII